MSIPENINIPWDFSCGIDVLDRNRIYINKGGITADGLVRLCHSCGRHLSRGRRPREAEANHRWIGPIPKELEDLTWLEELLIARVHVCGSIIRLGQRNNPSAFFGIKGHVVFLPQDTTRLLNLLPMSPASLPDMVKVVWTGKTIPSRSSLKKRFLIRKYKVYEALQWLVHNHEDYQENVIIDQSMIDQWKDTFVAVELLDSISRVSDASAEDAARDGFGMDDPDNDETSVDPDAQTDETAADLPFTFSGIVDVNNISEVPDAITLNRLNDLKNDITINVTRGSKMLNYYNIESLFTSAFPTLFPYDTGKHRDMKRGDNELSLLAWMTLMLRHSSGYFSFIYQADV